MAISFDKIFGIHATSLELRAKRTEVLASNLANADTPGYKARELSFDSVLKGAGSDRVRLQATDSRHLQPAQDYLGAEMMYRIPQQPSLDGNTVESHIEQGKFTENALRYQATLGFINGRVSGIKKALRGD